MPKQLAFLPSRVFIGQGERRPPDAAPSADRYRGAATPLRALIGELLNRKDLVSVSIQTKDLQLAIGR